MTERKSALGRNPAVGHYAYNGGHEQRHNSLHHIEHIDLVAETNLGEKHAHGDQIGSPDGELKKTQSRKTDADFSHTVQMTLREHNPCLTHFSIICGKFTNFFALAVKTCLKFVKV